MHPALQHPRRSQIRPLDSGSVAHFYCTGFERVRGPKVACARFVRAWLGYPN